MNLRDDILERLDIVDLVSRYVSIKKMGKNRVGLCPFHKENSPSFTVAEDKQIFKCFGCGKGGNAVTFHMEIERLDFWDSIQMLAKDVGLEVKDYQTKGSGGGYGSKAQTAEQIQQKEGLKTLLDRSVKYFHTQLREPVGSTGLDYLQSKRGLSEKTINDRKLGFAPDGRYTMIEAMKAKGFSHDLMLDAGLVKRSAKGGSSNELYAFFRDRVMFPIYNHVGVPVAFGARKLNPEDNGPKYLNSPESPLYDKSKVLYGLNVAKQHTRRFEGSMIVVEGYMDVIALAEHDVSIGVATCGTSLTPEHIKLLKRNGEQVVLSFDKDKAGTEATVRALKLLRSNDKYPLLLNIPDGFKDIDDRLATQSTKGEDLYAQIKELMVEGFTGLVDRLQTMYTLTNPVERKKFQHTLFDCIHEIQDYGIFMMRCEQIGTILGIDKDFVVKQYKQYLSAQSVRTRRNSETSITVPDSHYQFLSLFYKSFLLEQGALAEEPALKDLHAAILNYSKIDTDHPISQLIQGNADSPALDSELIEQLLTYQLRWEQQREGSSDLQKLQTALPLIKKHLHTMVRERIKHPDTTGEQKGELVRLLRV